MPLFRQRGDGEVGKLRIVFRRQGERSRPFALDQPFDAKMKKRSFTAD